MGNVLRPVCDDHWIGVAGEEAAEPDGGLDPARFLAVRADRDRMQIGNDVALDPAMDMLGQRQHRVEFLVAMLGHQRQADQLAAKAVELGVEEIAHRFSP
jgi:hypothetical protein